jgi:hypothetical protein
MYELSLVELHILESACRTEALIEELEAGLAGQPLTVPGAHGKGIQAHPLFAEIAKQKGLLLRQINALKLPKDDQESADVIDMDGPRRPMTRSESARKAARTRWEGHYGSTA